jgi:hypothetical protein
MEGLSVIILALAAALVLFPLAFMAYVNVGGSYRGVQHFLGVRRTNKRAEALSITCSIDADCPSGYVCVNGHCVPSRS